MKPGGIGALLLSNKLKYKINNYKIYFLIK